MAPYFLDTSGLVKRYVAEVGSAWVTSIMALAAGNALYLARLTGVEVVSAIARRAAGGSLAPEHAATALTRFRAEFDTRFQVIAVTAALIKRAMALAEHHKIRAYDAVQLAAAWQAQRRCHLLAQDFTVVSSDLELNAAALAEGLLVEDPNSHP
jgi:predicted nucleic acid-binding protein